MFKRTYRKNFFFEATFCCFSKDWYSLLSEAGTVIGSLNLLHIYHLNPYNSPYQYYPTQMMGQQQPPPPPPPDDPNRWLRLIVAITISIVLLISSAGGMFLASQMQNIIPLAFILLVLLIGLFIIIAVFKR